MMLLSLHIIAIGMLSAVIGGIAYEMGKQEGLRLAQNYYAESQASESASPVAPSQT